MSEKQQEASAAAPDSGGKKKLMIIIIAVTLAVVGAGVGAAVLLMGGDDEEEVADGGDSEESADEGDHKEKKDKKGKKGKKGKKDKGHGEGEGETAYLTLEPPFVVNIQPSPHAKYLQIGMDLMAKDPLVMEDVKKHMPAVRNSVVMLLAAQTYDGLTTQEGKEKLRTDILASVQKILEEAGAGAVDQVYFTSFVMQ